MSGSIPHVRRTRPWRIAFAVYAVAMTVGTHWPRLQLGTADFPAPDKIMHMTAFAGLAVLLWRTRWIRSLLLTWLVAAAWTALDELSQSLPGLGRTLSWQDMFAGQIGVALAIGAIRALGPIGGAVNRRRLDLADRVFDETFARPATWAAVGAAGVASGFIGALVCSFVWRRLKADVELVEGVALGFVVGGGVGGYFVFELLRRRAALRVAAAQRCPACGAECEAVEFDEHGRGACPGCGETVYCGEWAAPSEPPRSLVLRMVRRPLVLGAVLGGAILLTYGALLVQRLFWPAAGSMLMAYDRLPADMRLALDLGALGVVVLIVMVLVRRELARFHDQRGVRCAWCKHDIHATPVTDGHGRCGECGAGFTTWCAGLRASE